MTREDVVASKRLYDIDSPFEMWDDLPFLCTKWPEINILFKKIASQCL